MNLLAISDLHLSPKTPERNQLFLQFLESAQSNQDRVLIVGDLFDLWFGWEDLTMDYQRPILSRMRELYAAGLHIDYVEGNRDFGISRTQGLLFRQVSSGALDIQWSGRTIHAEHGDMINEADAQYRMWRRMSKSRFTYFLLNHLPGFLTLRIALRLERDMKNTNQRHKSYYPDASAEKFALKHLASGADLIVVGHFHVEKSLKMQRENGNVLFYSLPGWEQGFRYLVIPPGDSTPYFTDWGRENGNSATA